MQRIIVIGGGAAGSAVVGEFLRRGKPGELEVVWLVGARAPGRGIAYSTTAEHHLLNVRAAGMGLFADDVGAFIRHANAQGWPVKGQDFVPRSWFGDYVEAVLAREIGAARARGLQLSVLSIDASAVRGNDATGYVVTTSGGDNLDADGVVLAIGGLPPEPLSVVSDSARASSAFVPDPWTWPQPAQPPQHVVVLGTGLTAVDVLQSASRQWPQAHLTAISRHGRLPQTHAAAPAQPYEHQADLIDMLKGKSRVAAWLHEVRAAIAEEGTEWRPLIDGIRPETQNLWRSLDLRERRRFLRHLRWMWESLRHRLPPQTVIELERLQAQGRLDVAAGRVLSVDGTNPIAVTMRPRGATQTRRYDADLVIQATGFNLGASSSDHPLVRQLVDDGVAHPDELDLGLAADGAGRLLASDGRPAHGLRCLGTLLRGSLWECSGLPEIRALAKAIARDMPGELLDARAKSGQVKPTFGISSTFALA
jgi:uncharacterized NAD(P)/FAD-binding protein YdhS